MNTKIAVAIVLGLALVGLLYVALGSMGNNLVYYWTPTEVIDAGEKAYSANVRLGGMVKAGSIDWDERALDLKFTVTDGSKDVRVYAAAMPPQMFRENIGVVVEGSMTPAGVFVSEKLLVKHDNQYKAPEDGRAPDMEEMMKTMSGGDS